MSELPDSWVTAPLSELLAALESGSRPRGGVRGIADGVPSIGGEHLNYTGGFDFESVKYVPRDFAAAMSKGRIQRHDILVVKDGATTGKTAFVDSRFPYDEAFVNEHVFVCRPKKEIEPQFLFRFLTSMDGQKRILENFKGSAQGGINQTFAPNTEVPLAPLPGQRRIVAKLETLLGKVDASQQRLAKIPVLLKRFRQSVLAAACFGRLTADWREEISDIEPASKLLERIASQFGKALPKCDASELPFDIPSSWESVQASDLCRPGKIITYGVLKPVWVEDGVPTVRVVDMKQGRIVLDAVAQCCPERAKKFSKTTLEAGDLLIAKDGATLDKTAFVPPELAGGNITQHVLRFPISRLVERVFVRLIIDSRHGQEWMKAETRGAALPGVNVGDFRRMPIPLPPLPEQQEIVRRVEGLFALADQLEARLAKARGQVEKLTPSVLARAFAGKLLPQDPTDEPAEKLLERIRTKP